MVRCIDFYRKWEKYPDWCHVHSARQVDLYIDLLKEFELLGVDINRIIEKKLLSEQSALLIHPIRGARRTKILEALSEYLVAGWPIPLHLVRKIIRDENPAAILKKYAESCQENTHIIRQSIPQEIIKKRAISPQVNIEMSRSGKIRLLTERVLTSGQVNILRDVMVFSNLDDEYAALHRVLMWAIERMEAA